MILLDRNGVEEPGFPYRYAATHIGADLGEKPESVAGCDPPPLSGKPLEANPFGKQPSEERRRVDRIGREGAASARARAR